MMGNFNTVTAITENIKKGLEALGVKFSLKSYPDPKQLPASLIPYGEIRYIGESFEYTHSQRPGYVEVDFEVSLTLRQRSPEGLLIDEQGWTHRLREALSVKTLNTSALLSSKLVSKVEAKGFKINRREIVSVLSMQLTVRYREG